MFSRKKQKKKLFCFGNGEQPHILKQRPNEWQKGDGFFSLCDLAIPPNVSSAFGKQEDLGKKFKNKLFMESQRSVKVQYGNSRGWNMPINPYL